MSVDIERMRSIAQRALGDGAWWADSDVREALDKLADVGDDTKADAAHIWSARPSQVLALIEEIMTLRAQVAAVEDTYQGALERSFNTTDWTPDDWETFTENVLHDIRAALDGPAQAGEES